MRKVLTEMCKYTEEEVEERTKISLGSVCPATIQPGWWDDERGQRLAKHCHMAIHGHCQVQCWRRCKCNSAGERMSFWSYNEQQHYMPLLPHQVRATDSPPFQPHPWRSGPTHPLVKIETKSTSKKNQSHKLTQTGIFQVRKHVRTFEEIFTPSLIFSGRKAICRNLPVSFETSFWLNFRKSWKQALWTYLFFLKKILKIKLEEISEDTWWSNDMVPLWSGYRVPQSRRMLKSKSWKKRSEGLRLILAASLSERSRAPTWCTWLTSEKLYMYIYHIYIYIYIYLHLLIERNKWIIEQRNE